MNGIGSGWIAKCRTANDFKWKSTTMSKGWCEKNTLRICAWRVARGKKEISRTWWAYSKRIDLARAGQTTAILFGTGCGDSAIGNRQRALGTRTK